MRGIEATPDDTRVEIGTFGRVKSTSRQPIQQPKWPAARWFYLRAWREPVGQTDRAPSQTVRKRPPFPSSPILMNNTKHDNPRLLLPICVKLDVNH